MSDKPIDYTPLIQTPLQGILYDFYGGEWKDQPDGGVAHAVVAAHKLGRKEAEEEMAGLCVEWHFHIADIEQRHRNEMTMLLEKNIALFQMNELLSQDIKEANIKLKEESDSHQETADMMRRIREDRDQLKKYLDAMLGD